MSAPPIPSIQQWLADYDGRCGPVIDLSQAVPGFAPPTTLLAALASAAGSAQYSGYGPIQGEAAFRSAYADHVNQVYEAQTCAAQVHITAGCNQAFAAAVMALLAPGDQLLLPCPFYFNHQTTLLMLGVEPVPLVCRAADGFVPRVEDVATAIDGKNVRALVLVTPNNPTGAVYPAQLIREIFELCQRRGVWLLIDETYRDFLPDELAAAPPHDLLRQANWRDNLILLYSFSKSFCIPGHRVGALLAGEAVVAEVTKVMDNLQICAPRPPQAALTPALQELAAWRDSNRRDISQRAHAFRLALAQSPAWKLDALGAYFAYVRHPFQGEDSEQVAQRLAQQLGVLTVPGAYFGPGQQQHLRMAFANVGQATIMRLSERLNAMVAN